MIKIFGLVILTEKEYEKNMKSEFIGGETYQLNKLMDIIEKTLPEEI